ncbi:MAG: glycosyltransferase [Eubacterium sp.]|nr:glycosyltransferase [Eubacterium sp.]
MPLISVIMGVYNSNPDMLKKSVESLLNQTLGDFELIICDDNSETVSFDFLPNDERIKIISSGKNKGLARSLNLCLEQARGKYIARQDDDDWSVPERFEKQAAFLDSRPDIDFVGSDCALFDSDGEIHGVRQMPAEVDKKDFLFNSPFIHGSVMFRREILENCRYRTVGRTKKYEDYDLFMRLYANGCKAANINEQLYYFYYDTKLRSVSFKMRVDEYKVRMNGFKKLGLLPKGFFHAVKPLILGLMPGRLQMRLKKTFNKV